jgi:ribosome-associated toxin RatA of RatAB toxin-antitoxin module
MTMIQKSALVKYAAHQMFDLVDDVEAYPEFLP